MPSFIKESIFYKIFDSIFIKPYFNSKLKKFMNKFIICFKESFIYKWFIKYINKNPYFLNSFSYKVFRKFISLVDKLMDLLNRFFGKLIKGSKIYDEAKSINSLEIDTKILMLSLLIGALDLGYILGGIIFKTINPIISFGLLIICFLLYIFSVNQNTYRESFIYKFIKYLF